MLPLQVPLSRILVLENHEGEQQTCGSQKCRTCGTDMTQCLTKKVPRGFEQVAGFRVQSADRYTTGPVNGSFDKFPELQLPFPVLPRDTSTTRRTACTLAPLHWLGGQGFGFLNAF